MSDLLECMLGRGMEMAPLKWGNIVDVFKDLKGIIIKKIKEKQKKKKKNQNITIKDFFECLQELREKLSSLTRTQRYALRKGIGSDKEKTLLWWINAMTPTPVSDTSPPGIDAAGESVFIEKTKDGYEVVFIPRPGERNEEYLNIFKDCLNEELVKYNRSSVSERELEPVVVSVSEFKPSEKIKIIPRRRRGNWRKGALSRKEAEARRMLVPSVVIPKSDHHKDIHLLGDSNWTYRSLIKEARIRKGYNRSKHCKKDKKSKNKKMKRKFKSKKRKSKNSRLV